MVKPSRSAWHDGDVMRRWPLPEPCGHRHSLGVDEHLAHAELQDLLKELDGLGGLGRSHKRVIQAQWRDSLKALRPRRWVDGGQKVASVFHLVVELDEVA